MRRVKFVLEVELGESDGNAAQELGRILRYWGGSLNDIPLVPGTGFPVYDSAYREVGRWRIVPSDAPSAESVE